MSLSSSTTRFSWADKETKTMKAAEDEITFQKEVRLTRTPLFSFLLLLLSSRFFLSLSLNVLCRLVKKASLSFGERESSGQCEVYLMDLYRLKCWPLPCAPFSSLLLLLPPSPFPPHSTLLVTASAICRIAASRE